MKAQFVVIMLAAILALVPVPDAVAADCTDDGGARVNCADRVGRAMRNLRESENLRDAARNAAQVGKAAKDCVQCALNSIDVTIDRDTSLTIDKRR